MKNNKPLPAEFITAPAVFAVGNCYQIMVPVSCELLFGAEIGGKKYYDHSNGIIRSDTRIHRVSVPMEALDKTGEYTLFFNKVIKRKPYYTETEDEVRLTYKFFPVRSEGRINIYHLSDTHGSFSLPAETGSFFGDGIDLLILNGDILDHSGEIENFLLTFKLCEAITCGEHPCVFSRGNHDLRGFYAERLADYCPNDNGKSYYTFRLGKIWGIVMDCGEDKVDSHEEYGKTVACSQFRREETGFLKSVTEKGEYLSDGIEYRFVIVHNPFTYTLEPPFDIEQELFTEWADILKNGIKPNAIISGHLHETCVSEIGGRLDSKGQPCPVIIGSRNVGKENGEAGFIGCAIMLEDGKITVAFTDSKHNITEKTDLP
ncbi:MAG: metallophosphoesterase [Eubacterium sp.]|nr:metallophosphoesterase [Eubacterium sp.]